MGPGQRLEGWGGVKSKPAEQEVISPQAESSREHTELSRSQQAGEGEAGSSGSCMEDCPPSPWGSEEASRGQEESQWAF